MIHLAEANLDEDVSELLGAFAVSCSDHALDQLLQGLLLRHDYINEGRDLVLGDPAVLHELDNNTRRNLKVFIIFSAQLLEDEIDHGSIL